MNTKFNTKKRFTVTRRTPAKAVIGSLLPQPAPTVHYTVAHQAGKTAAAFQPAFNPSEPHRDGARSA